MYELHGKDLAKESNVRFLCSVPAHIYLHIISGVPAGPGKLLKDTVVFDISVYKDLTFQYTTFSKYQWANNKSRSGIGLLFSPRR